MTYIIAEAGINHNGDISLARRLIDAAVSAKADAVKFQLYQSELLAPPGEKREMLRQYQFHVEQMTQLAAHCFDAGIEFLCTPFDMKSADQLEPLVRRYKIGSGQSNDIEFLGHVSSKGKPMIISTGMSEFGDIRHALTAVDVPVTLLHCVSLYPTPSNKANLQRMIQMKRSFAMPIGYSDHTEGIHIALAAVALGAEVIEKHITLDKTMPGPDHKASITPDELKALIRETREIERALESV
jgi:N,N'-diacetyllegionaminate synthase